MRIIYIIIGAAFICLLQFTQHAIFEQEEGELCETIINQK